MSQTTSNETNVNVNSMVNMFPVSSNVSSPTDNLTSTTTTEHSTALTPMKKKKPGRSPSQIWMLLTDEPNPQRQNSAACKHCKQLVLYYKKSEQAIRHLRKCSVFQSSQHQFSFIAQFQDILPLYNQKINAKASSKKRQKTNEGLTHANINEMIRMGNLPQHTLDTTTHQVTMNNNTLSHLSMQHNGLPEGLIDSTNVNQLAQLKDDTQDKEGGLSQGSKQENVRDNNLLLSRKRKSGNISTSSTNTSMANNIPGNPHSLLVGNLGPTTGNTTLTTPTSHQPLSKVQQERMEEELAMHIYTSGLSFDTIEQSHLQRAMAVLRSTVKLPDKKRLETDLLHRCYEKMYKRVWGYLLASSTRVCLKRDAWSNMNLYGITAGSDAFDSPTSSLGTGLDEEYYRTYMAVNSEKRFFLESEKVSEESGGSPYNSIYIAQDIKRVMAPIVHNVSGVVTGSTEHHARAWEMLKAEYPTKFFYGCISHALHLAIADIFGKKDLGTSDGMGHQEESTSGSSDTNGPGSIASRQSSTKANYPFQDIAEFTERCNELISFLASYQYSPKFKLFEAQTLQTMHGFANASNHTYPTLSNQWGTLPAKFRVLSQCEDVIQSIVSDADFVDMAPINQRATRESIRDFVMNCNWKYMLEKAISILQPIELILYKFQDDKAAISEVYFESKHLLLDFDTVFGLSTAELNYIKKVVTDRWQYVLGEAHGLAFLLDPRYIGRSMTREYREQIEELIFNYPESDADMIGVNEERKRTMSHEYTEYVIYAKNQRANRTFKWEMLEKGNRSPLQFWMTDADDWPHLKQLALTLFSLAPSSVASDKTLCKTVLTQANRRNKLSTDDMRRLAFICINDAQFSAPPISNHYNANAMAMAIAMAQNPNTSNNRLSQSNEATSSGATNLSAANTSNLADFNMDAGLSTEQMIMWMI